MSVQQLLASYGAAAGGGSIPTTNLWGAYGISLLIPTWSGAALRVRRSSDNAEQDIGFSGVTLDTASLASFVGANSGYVTTVYDQSGGTNHLIQATSASQPRIVNAGTYDGFIRFDDADDGFQSANNSGTPTGISVFIKGALRSIPSTEVYIELANDGVVAAGFLAYAMSSTTQLYSGPNSARIGQAFNTTTLATASVHAYRLNRTLGSKTDQLRLWSNGSSVAATGTDNGSTTSPTSVASNKWNVGARANATSLWAPLNLTSLLIYEDAKSDAEMSAISGLI